MEFFIFRALIFLFPLAAYCLFLAMLNSREHPTMVSGSWDFAGVLLATSGFLLAGGPTILGALYGDWRTQTALGLFPGLGRGASDLWYLWIVVWLAYFAVVIGGAVYLLRKRRHVTVVYNVDPAVLDQLLTLIAEQFRLACRRVGNRLFLTPAVREGKPVPSNGEPLPQVADERRAGLELEPFLSMCHVTLRWQGDPSLRRDVEAELERQLRATAAPDNPSASWFLTVASSLFGLLFLALVGFIMWRMRRGA